jgi:hypothetical protein
LSPRVGRDYKRGKVVFHANNGNNLLKLNIWLISFKLGTNLSCMKEIQVYLNEGPNSLWGLGCFYKSAKIE